MNAKRFLTLVAAATLAVLAYSQIPATFVRSGIVPGAGAAAPPPVGCDLTTQIDQTASRALATAYQNLTGCPLFIQISGIASSGGTLRIFSDGSNPPTGTQIGGATLGNTSFEEMINIIVQNNQWYELTADGGAGIFKWIETH